MLANLPIRLAPRPLAHFNQARLGYPRRVYFGSGGGIGDDLLCTCVFRELKKRGEANTVFRTRYRPLFQGNPDIDRLIRVRIPLFAGALIHGLKSFQLSYQIPTREHILRTMCRVAGLAGEAALRPYVFLRPDELAAGRRFDRQMVIQSSGLGANIPMQNKEWFPERFQLVADALRSEVSLIQLGTAADPPLKGALDLRGQTSLREAAAILSQAAVFVGQVGFLMHLARAVDCRSVIVYGGRETPETTGYIANKNVIGITPCAPCWEENKCDYGRECMRMISAETVVRAAIEQMDSWGQPLETEVTRLGS